MDVISITDLQLRCPFLESDHWGRPQKDQPLVCNVSISTNVASEARIDDLLPDGQSCNYGAITKAIEKSVNLFGTSVTEREGVALEVLAESLAKAVLNQGAPEVTLTLERPRAHLSARSIGVSINRTRSGTLSKADKFIVKSLERDVIIGLNEPERHDLQRILVDLTFESVPMVHTQARKAWSAWKPVLKQVEQVRPISAL